MFFVSYLLFVVILLCTIQQSNGAVAQLEEQVLCKHQVVGSIPIGSTSSLLHLIINKFCFRAHSSVG
jgi:hypothetical protein